MTKQEIMKEAKRKAGYRERYAVQNGELNINGNLWIFVYSTDDPYQDANGATYDCTEGKWIG